MENKELFNKTKKLIMEKFNLIEENFNENAFRQLWFNGEIYVYENKKELYRDYNLGCSYKLYDLEKELNNVLDTKIQEGFKTVLDLIIYKMSINLENYNMEYMIISEDLYILMEYGTLEYLQLDFFAQYDMKNLYTTIKEIFSGYKINKDSIKNGLKDGKIRFYKTKEEFINSFEYDKNDMLKFIFNYNSENDDFIKEPQDIAITYLEEKNIISDRYSLFKIETDYSLYNNTDNNSNNGSYIFIDCKVIE